MSEIGTALILVGTFFIMWLFTSEKDVRLEIENEVREGFSDGSLSGEPSLKSKGETK